MVKSAFNSRHLVLGINKFFFCFITFYSFLVFVRRKKMGMSDYSSPCDSVLGSTPVTKT